MLLYSRLIIIWEPHVEQIPWLAKRAHQPLDKTDLVIENALLRQQLSILKRQLMRPQLTNPELFRLVFLSHFTVFWKQALHIVQPNTLLRWHRELFQFY